VDSGILIRLLRGDRQAGLLLNHLRDVGEIATSAVSVFEVFRGCRNEPEHQAAESVFEALPVRGLTYSSATVAASLMGVHAGVLSGEKSIPDALIAATAIIDGSALVTLNTRQFFRIQHPDLELLLIDQGAPDWVAAVS
jgi:predicted nucleic acid-binding protein